MTFANNLERIRKDKKVSQARLAKALGVTQQMISNYEKGLSSPNIEVLIKIADFFNISIDFLVGHKVKEDVSLSPQSRLVHYKESFSQISK